MVLFVIVEGSVIGIGVAVGRQSGTVQPNVITPSRGGSQAVKILNSGQELTYFTLYPCAEIQWLRQKTNIRFIRTRIRILQ